MLDMLDMLDTPDTPDTPDTQKDGTATIRFKIYGYRVVTCLMKHQSIKAPGRDRGYAIPRPGAC
jgi:hypothetical protein